MRQNKILSNILIVAFCTVLFSLNILMAAAAKPAKTAKAPAVSAETPQSIWNKTAKKWDTEINSYHTKLFSWTYKTDAFIKNFPEFNKKDKPTDVIKPDWDYRVFDLRFKKPMKAFVGYDLSLNEDLEGGSIIDKGVAYMLTYAKGTMLQYGYKDDKEIYIVFPYLTNKQFEKMPVPMVWKAMMKVLMIASRKEVYHKPLDKMLDLRGNSIADLSIGRTMKRYEHYFKDGKVTLSKVPLYTKDDYNLDKNTGWLTIKENINRPATIYQLTMVPNNVKANREITKVEAFIDPKTMTFVGLHEYENGKLIQVLLFSDLTLNPELPDKLWEDFFKGRTLSDKS